MDSLLLQTAEVDGREVHQRLEQEPGSSGKFAIDQMITKTLMGFDASFDRPTGNKLERMKPLSSEAQVGNVHLVNGPGW